MVNGECVPASGDCPNCMVEYDLQRLSLNDIRIVSARCKNVQQYLQALLIVVTKGNK